MNEYDCLSAKIIRILKGAIMVVVTGKVCFRLFGADQPFSPVLFLFSKQRKQTKDAFEQQHITQRPSDFSSRIFQF